MMPGDYLANFQKVRPANLAQVRAASAAALKMHQDFFLRDSALDPNDFLLQTTIQTQSAPSNPEQLVSCSRIWYSRDKLKGLRVTAYVDDKRAAAAMTRYPRNCFAAHFPKITADDQVGTRMTEIYKVIESNPALRWSDLRFQRQAAMYSLAVRNERVSKFCTVEYVYSRDSAAVFRFDETRE